MGSDARILIAAGWSVTASWPIDTERGGRLRARNSAALASSVHLVCRPREKQGNQERVELGDWRDVLHELPRRIHEWMPRLAEEGIVGADAIFACLGPALEIFSRYDRVEKANGDRVELREFLTHVWAAVAKEAVFACIRRMTTMKIAIYCRVSTRDKGQDTANQRLQLEQFARKQGWKVVEVYEDRASGKRGESGREAFKEMFAAAASRQWNLILFWSLDRFSREGAFPTLRYLTRLSAVGRGRKRRVPSRGGLPKVR